MNEIVMLSLELIVLWWLFAAAMLESARHGRLICAAMLLFNIAISIPLVHRLATIIKT